MHSYDSPLQHLDKHKTHPFMHLCLLSMCIYVWVWIVVCTLRHMLLVFFSFIKCAVLCVCTCVCTHTKLCLRACKCASWPLWWGWRENGSRKKTTLSEPWNALGLGITLARAHGKTQRRASAARQMRGWESAWLWLCVASVEAFSHSQSSIKGCGSLFNCICLSHLWLSESFFPSVYRCCCLDSNRIFLSKEYHI